MSHYLFMSLTSVGRNAWCQVLSNGRLQEQRLVMEGILKAYNLWALAGLDFSVYTYWWGVSITSEPSMCLFACEICSYFIQSYICMASKVVSNTWLVGFIWKLWDCMIYSNLLRVVQCHARYIFARFVYSILSLCQVPDLMVAIE